MEEDFLPSTSQVLDFKVYVQCNFVFYNDSSNWTVFQRLFLSLVQCVLNLLGSRFFSSLSHARDKGPPFQKKTKKNWNFCPRDPDSKNILADFHWLVFGRRIHQNVFFQSYSFLWILIIRHRHLTSRKTTYFSIFGRFSVFEVRFHARNFKNCSQKFWF